jgi:hypothetical protein
MTEIVYKLENFDTPLENSRIFFLLGRGRQPPKLLDQLINSPKVTNRVLVSSQHSETPLLFKGLWSAIFNPSDGKDWQLVLTYCTYMTKPGIIVIEDGLHIPEGFMARLPTVNLQFAICRQICQQQPANLLAVADTIFLPVVEDLAGADADACLTVLKQQLGVNGAVLDQRKEWLREVRAVRSCLVWTRIQERSTHGAVYWFDPADDLEINKHYSTKQVKKYLEALGDVL